MNTFWLDFFSMGGYGVYVWSAFFFTFLVMVQIIRDIKQLKKTLRTIVHSSVAEKAYE